MLGLVLARGCQEKTAVRSKSQPPEEGREGLIRIEAGILDAGAGWKRFRRRLHRHDGGEGHRRRRTDGAAR